MNIEKQIEELSEAIFKHCPAGLFESEAKMIAEFVILRCGYRRATDVALDTLTEIASEVYKRIPRKVDKDRGGGTTFDLGREYALLDLLKFIHELIDLPSHSKIDRIPSYVRFEAKLFPATLNVVESEDKK